MSIKSVTFKSFGVDLVGNLYLPEDFDANKNTKPLLVQARFHKLKNRS
ncbi:hypothetical protein [Aliamphritea spongicola]|nr:hypothetical protein [Aliamphritea spongicola]